jgi:hypothetical protein
MIKKVDLIGFGDLFSNFVDKRIEELDLIEFEDSFDNLFGSCILLIEDSKI